MNKYYKIYTKFIREDKFIFRIISDIVHTDIVRDIINIVSNGGNNNKLESVYIYIKTDKKLKEFVLKPTTLKIASDMVNNDNKVIIFINEKTGETVRIPLK